MGSRATLRRRKLRRYKKNRAITITDSISYVPIQHEYNGNGISLEQIKSALAAQQRQSSHTPGNAYDWGTYNYLGSFQ